MGTSNCGIWNLYDSPINVIMATAALPADNNDTVLPLYVLRGYVTHSRSRNYY